MVFIAMLNFALAALNVALAAYNYSNGGIYWLNAGAAVFCFGCGIIASLASKGE